MTTLDDLTRQQADLATHHIEGIAVMGDTPFSVPLISHITGNLWTGGCIGGVRLPDDFAYVVSLYPWEQYDLGPGTLRHEIRLYDATEVPREDVLLALARGVNDRLRMGKTLVHCQAGLNRSALVAGLALIEGGMDPAEAVALLRDKRSPAVLCNGAFEAFLLNRTHTRH